MIRKIAAISFILIANLIMLAHAVIPHHHHNEAEICVDTSHYKGHSECHNHSNEAHHHHSGSDHSNDIFHQHEHDENNDYQCCLVKPVVILPSNSIDLECKSYQTNLHTLSFDNFNFLNQRLNKVYPTGRFKEICATLSALYPQISKQSFGLRAPPLT